MITIQNLHKRFANFHALRGINLHVAKGEVYGFIGHNGAGKSTTMNILAGLSRPSSGTCIVNGKDVAKVQHPSELNIGYLPEDPRFYPWMTATETLLYLSRIISPKRVDEVLEWVGLKEAKNRRVGGFSRGMKQRLGIGAALIHNPELLILDEPSSALDPQGRSDVIQLIGELKRMGKTVLFSTHILADVERVCDTVGIIVSGNMTMEKPLAVIRKENILPIYDIALQAPPSVEMLQEIGQLAGVTAAEHSGTTLAVTVADTAVASKQLLQFLATQNIEVRAIALRENQLEDIFIQEVKGK